MMRSFIAFLFCAFVLGAFSISPASAALIPGDPCPEVGKTVMAADQRNILACLCETPTICSGTANLKWKIMTVDILTTGTFNCPSGKAIVKIVNGVPECAAY